MNSFYKRELEYVPVFLQGNLFFISAFGVETQPLFWSNFFYHLNDSSYGFYGYIKLAMVLNVEQFVIF